MINGEIAVLLDNFLNFYVRMSAIVRPYEGFEKHKKEAGLTEPTDELIEKTKDAISSLQSDQKIPRFYCFMKWVKERQHDNETFAQLFLNAAPACLHTNEETGGKWQAAIKRTLNALRILYGEQTYDEMGHTRPIECDE
jgi:hypothetical protein